MDAATKTNRVMEHKQKNIFTQGAIAPAFIADSIAKHSSKTNIGGHSIFLGQVRADVIDDKKVRYHISRFIVVHRSKDKYEDEKTGEVKSRYNSTAADVKNSGFLSKLWQKNLYEIIKKEDEILITDIIVKDKYGYYYTAPDIKIKVM